MKTDRCPVLRDADSKRIGLLTVMGDHRGYAPKDVGVEWGAPIWRVMDEFVVGDWCRGTAEACLVTSRRDPAFYDYGIVHNHPRGDFRPSVEDFRLAVSHGDKYICISKVDGGEPKMRCWIRPGEISRDTQIDLWRQQTEYDEQAQAYNAIMFDSDKEVMRRWRGVVEAEKRLARAYADAFSEVCSYELA